MPVMACPATDNLQYRYIARFNYSVRSPPRRAGPPEVARLRRHFQTSARSPAEPSLPEAEGKGAGQPGGPLSRLCAPHPECQRVHPRGCEEEGDDGGVAIVSRHMQAGRAPLQVPERRRRGKGRGREEDLRGREDRTGGGRKACRASGGAGCSGLPRPVHSRTISPQVKQKLVHGQAHECGDAGESF